MLADNFARVTSEFRRTRIIYCVEKLTGAIKPLSLTEYRRASDAGLLRGYVVRLAAGDAQATAAKVRRAS